MGPGDTGIIPVGRSDTHVTQKSGQKVAPIGDVSSSEGPFRCGMGHCILAFCQLVHTRAHHMRPKHVRNASRTRTRTKCHAQPTRARSHRVQHARSPPNAPHRELPEHMRSVDRRARIETHGPWDKICPQTAQTMAAAYPPPSEAFPQGERVRSARSRVHTTETMGSPHGPGVRLGAHLREHGASSEITAR